jgi:hypothetical protein
MNNGGSADDVWLPWDADWMDRFLADPSHSFDDLVKLESVCPQPYAAP